MRFLHINRQNTYVDSPFSIFIIFKTVINFYNMERVARIELARPGRKHGILPLNYTRKSNLKYTIKKIKLQYITCKIKDKYDII